MHNDPEKAGFLASLGTALDDGTFVKLALAKYRGPGGATRCSVTIVALKAGAHLRFATRQGMKDTTENLNREAAVLHLGNLIGGTYFSATLFTTREDVSLVYSRKKVAQLNRAKPTLSEAPPAAHDRSKNYIVDSSARFLAKLGVTHVADPAKGPAVKPSMYAKFRQICRFVEILDQLLAASSLRDTTTPRIVDIGSGKGYLTFALHEHLRLRLGRAPRTLGLEMNADLVAQCITVATDCTISGVTFKATRAEDWAVGDPSGIVDILIALHACDTATDDAIHLGIARNAQLIVCAPCCQHEIAPQLAIAGAANRGLLKYPLLKQRYADLVTDAARALLLEAAGYDVRIIEFVSTEHSAKNLMIAAVKSNEVDRGAAADQYRRLMVGAGVSHHRLKDLLRRDSFENLTDD